MSEISNDEAREIFASEPCRDPLSIDDADPQHPETIELSTGGLACLVAYWMFSSDVFDAHYKNVDIDVFPGLHVLMKNLAGDNSQVEIMANPGTFEALVVMAVWLDSHKGTIPASAKSTKEVANVMSYHHLLTLIAVFHPNIRVRNAAAFMAGSVLHSDPDENSRLAILEDLMENCVFSTLQACAVNWLKEEMIAARKVEGKSHFAGPECFDKLQYTVFPDLKHLKEADASTLWEFWTQSSPFHLQVVNFALFLFGGKDFKDAVPAGMGTAVEHRYVEPLVQAGNALAEALEKKEITDPGAEEAKVQLGLLTDTLKRIPLQ